MAYQLKYWFQFASLDGKENVVELWQDTATVLTEEEVETTAMPFSVEMPEIDHKFQTVRGTGCEINLLSPTDRKFFDGLYHTQMKEFMIKHYIDDVINWVGYLNSELVRESYSEETNYPFQITGNDGFSLMDRLQFLQNDGTKYTGMLSMFDLLQIALDRIGLPYENIYICLTTTFVGQVQALGDSILHESYLDCANFYNEDGEAETMRKVIEGCLSPFGAVITQIGGSIYITDVNTIGIGSGSFLVYDQATGVYEETLSIDLTKDITTIGYMGTGSEIEMSGGKNKQVVSYSPYPFKAVVPEGLKDLAEFSGSIPETFSLRDYDLFAYKSLLGHNSLNINYPAVFEQSYCQFLGETEADASICIEYNAATALAGSVKVVELKINPMIVFPKGNDVLIPGTTKYGFKGSSIKITGEAYFFRYWFTHAYGNDYTNTGEIQSYEISSIVRIGDKSADAYGDKTNWNAYPAIPQLTTLIKISDGGSEVSGKWMPFSVEGNDCYVTTHEDLSGLLYLDFYDQLDFTDFNGDRWAGADVPDQHPQVRLRNISISFIDSETKKEINDADIEYIGYLDKTVKDEAEKIELICGTDVNHADRGKIMMYAIGIYTSIKQWTRFGQVFKIEELLLNSLSSNYRMGYISLSNLKLRNGFNQLNTITDSLIPDKNFMVKSMKINYRDDLIETALTEVTPDALTIVPYG
jgi:hypothetical protein